MYLTPDTRTTRLQIMFDYLSEEVEDVFNAYLAMETEEARIECVREGLFDPEVEYHKAQKKLIRRAKELNFIIDIIEDVMDDNSTDLVYDDEEEDYNE